MKRRQQQHLQASQSPLTCSLAIIIRMQLPNREASHGRTVGHFPRDIAVSNAVFCMSLSSMVKPPTAGTLSWRFIQLASGKIPKANMVSRLCITRLVVAGLGSHFLVSWSVRCIAWLIFIMGNTRIASELECTVGCSAMLCPHVYELQLLRNQCLFQNIGQCFNSDV